MPPLLSPTVDPGPGAHLLLPGGSSLAPSIVRGGGTHPSFMFSPSPSQAQVAPTPWEKLQTGLLSTQTRHLLGGSSAGADREAASPAHGLLPTPNTAQAAGGGAVAGAGRVQIQSQLSRLHSCHPAPGASSAAGSGGNGAVSSDPDCGGLGSTVLCMSRHTAVTEGHCTGDEGSVSTLQRGLLGTMGQSAADTGNGMAAGSADTFNPRLLLTSPVGARAGGANGLGVLGGGETSGESSMYVAINASNASNATSLRQDSTRGQLDFRGIQSILNSHRSSSRPMQGLAVRGRAGRGNQRAREDKWSAR